MHKEETSMTDLMIIEIAGKLSEKEFDHRSKADNTIRQYLNFLHQFSTLLCGDDRYVEALYRFPAAWGRINRDVLKEYKTWLEGSGYSINSIRQALSCIHSFVKEAGNEGVISREVVEQVCAIRGESGRRARNLDSHRVRESIPTRKGHKKAAPTSLTPDQVREMKKVAAERSSRDGLIIGLLSEHALRIGEVRLLEVDWLDIDNKTIKVYGEKTFRLDTLELQEFTLQQAKKYLAEIDRKEGPLFIGYQQARISEECIDDIVRGVGRAVGLNISSHDFRHNWTVDAFRNENSLDIIQAGGRWETPAMPLYYAKRMGTVKRVQLTG
jgi:integrase